MPSLASLSSSAVTGWSLAMLFNSKIVSLIATDGALHKGHMRLIEVAKNNSDIVILVFRLYYIIFPDISPRERWGLEIRSRIVNRRQWFPT